MTFNLTYSPNITGNKFLSCANLQSSQVFLCTNSLSSQVFFCTNPLSSQVFLPRKPSVLAGISLRKPSVLAGISPAQTYSPRRYFSCSGHCFRKNYLIISHPPSKCKKNRESRPFPVSLQKKSPENATPTVVLVIFSKTTVTTCSPIPSLSKK